MWHSTSYSVENHRFPKRVKSNPKCGVQQSKSSTLPSPPSGLYLPLVSEASRPTFPPNRGTGHCVPPKPLGIFALLWCALSSGDASMPQRRDGLPVAGQATDMTPVVPLLRDGLNGAASPPGEDYAFPPSSSATPSEVLSSPSPASRSPRVEAFGVVPPRRCEEGGAGSSNDLGGPSSPGEWGIPPPCDGIGGRDHLELISMEGLSDTSTASPTNNINLREDLSAATVLPLEESEESKDDLSKEPPPALQALSSETAAEGAICRICLSEGDEFNPLVREEPCERGGAAPCEKNDPVSGVSVRWQVLREYERSRGGPGMEGAGSNAGSTATLL